MTKKISILLPLFLLSLLGISQSSKNITLAANLSYPNNLNDIWGYVDASGNEYGLVGTTQSVSIVDVNDPTNPLKLHNLPGVFSVWRDIKTWGNFAYVSNESGDGLRVIDLSGLPGTVDYKDTVIKNVSTIHNLWIDENGFLYASGPNRYNGGIMILDLNNDPWKPEFVGRYNNTYVHDVYVRNNLAYAAEIYDGLLTVIDMTVKSNPQILGSVTYTDAFTHNTWLNDAGTVCFTTDEFDEAYIHAWDITDPTNITLLDKIRSSVSNEKAAPHNTHVLNDFLITSYYKDGIHIVDAARPNGMIEVGYYDTSPLSNGGLEGNWGAYPYLPSGIILASDMQEGLFVLEPTYLRACYLEGNVTDASTNAPISNATISFVSESLTDESLTNGAYSFGIADAGTYAVEISKYGYVSQTVNVMLTNGDIVIQDFAMTPTPRTDLTIQVLDSVTGLAIPNAIIEAEADGAPVNFSFVSDATGEVTANQFVSNDYVFTLGTWGYNTFRETINVPAGTQTITLYMKPGYYDDFIFDFGWSESGDATTGSWVRGEPLGTFTFGGTPYNPDEDLPNDYGDQAYVTGNSGTNIGDDDVDDGRTILTSPMMDLSIYKEPLISYHWWLINYNSQTGNQGNEYLSVLLSSGTDTVEIARHEGEFENFWHPQDSLSVPAEFDLSLPIQIHFITQDFDPQDFVEAAVDGFVIVEGDTTTPQDTTTSLVELLQPGEFQVYPVPVQDRLTLANNLPATYQDGKLTFELIDLQGRHVKTFSLPVGKKEFHLDFPYSRGIYFGTLKHNGQPLTVRKIIK